MPDDPINANGSKLHVLPQAADDSVKQHKAAMETIARNLSNIEDLVKLTAKSRRMCFDALCNEGFDEDQALAIVTSAFRSKGFLPSVI